MSSRAALNAKLVKRHQQRQAATQARTSTNKFSQKQSHYELRREEEQARQVQQHSGTSFIFGEGAAAQVRSVGDGLLRSHTTTTTTNTSMSGQQWSPMRLRSQSALQSTTTTTGIISSKKKMAVTGSTRDGHLFVGGGAVTRPRTNTNTITTTNEVVSQPVMQRSLVKPRSAKADYLSTRSTRRVSRFHLGEDNNTAMQEEAEEEAEEEVEEVAVLGQRRGRTLPTTQTNNNIAEENEEEPPRKLTKQEKFYEVIANSKQQRATQQRERQDRDEVTKELDAEINALMHLLPRRDPEADERRAFAASGNREVRALLAQYKKNHTAKHVSLKSSGEVVITPLTQIAAAVPSANITNKDTKNTMIGDTTTTTTITDNNNNDEEDDFDAMLQRMSLDPRRAHATERLLDESEVAERALQQQVLQEDRQAVPLLELQEREQVQQTRREWLREGGNEAVQMDDLDKIADKNSESGEGSVFSDNADLPSSYEGDSEEDMKDEEEHEEGVEEKKSNNKVNEGVGATLTGHSQKGLDALLTAIEAIALTTNNNNKESSNTDGKSKTALEAEYSSLVQALYRYAVSHTLEVVQVFRALLIEAEKEFLRGARHPPSRAVLLYLHTATLLFPATDFRHAVMTPLLIFICSTLAQVKLSTRQDVHGAIWLAALLVQCLRHGGNKFCAEAVVTCLNVIALQLPRNVLEPARFQTLRVPFPVLDRCEDALLTTINKKKKEDKGAAAANGDDDAVVIDKEGAEKGTEAVRDCTRGPLPIGLLDDITTSNSDEYAEKLLLSAYRLLYELTDMYRTVPAFAVMLSEPFDALDTLILGEKQTVMMSEAVRVAHDTLRTRLHQYAKEASEHRTPLAMRSFRPRPLRQYDPLLAETAEHAVRSETKELKRGLREDKKRLVRHLKAEATVQRRAHEKESALIDAQRERQYHVVLGQLQAQQHAMNTVDAMMAKAKSKPRKGLSGAPKSTAGNDAGGSNGMGE